MSQQKMAVTVPAGMQGGMELKVQTPAGMMMVTIPKGLRAGQEFHMMVPAPAPAQPMVRQVYYTWLGLFICLSYNVICVTLACFGRSSLARIRQCRRFCRAK